MNVILLILTTEMFRPLVWPSSGGENKSRITIIMGRNQSTVKK